jgi:hypothetical protein
MLYINLQMINRQSIIRVDSWERTNIISRVGFITDLMTEITIRNNLLQVEDIESKVEQLLELYLEDRKRLLAILPPLSPNISPPSSGNDGGAAFPPTTTTSSGTNRHRPRPILVGKQVKTQKATV